MDDRKKRWADLNSLAQEWYELPAPGNEAKKQSMEERLFAGVLELLPQRKVDALGIFWLKDWKNFDPGKGSFAGFVNERLVWWAKTIKHQDLDKRRKQITDPDTGEKKTRWVSRNTSLNAPIGDEEETGELEEMISDPTHERERVMAGMLLLALALKLQHQLSSAKGEQKRYFPLFFTDGVTHLIQEAGSFDLNAREEKEILSSIRLPFLDFFTSRECRSLAALAQVRMKPYGELVEKRPMKETNLPLPDDVFMAYLKKIEQYPVSASAISQQRKAYKRFGKSLEL